MIRSFYVLGIVKERIELKVELFCIILGLEYDKRLFSERGLQEKIRAFWKKASYICEASSGRRWRKVSDDNIISKSRPYLKKNKDFEHYLLFRGL